MMFSAPFYIWLYVILDGDVTEKSAGCGCAIAVIGILGLAAYGLVRLFG